METNTKRYQGKTVLNTTRYADGTAHLELWGAHPELGSIRTYENGARTTIVRTQMEG
jgi:hypothetical protein